MKNKLSIVLTALLLLVALAVSALAASESIRLVVGAGKISILRADGETSLDFLDVDVDDGTGVITWDILDKDGTTLLDETMAAGYINLTDAGGYFGTDTVEAATQALAVNGAGLAAKLEGLYQVSWTGVNSGGGDATAALTVKTAGVTPAVGDLVVQIICFATAGGAFAQVGVVGTDYTQALLDDTGVKIQQLQAAGDLSADTCVGLVVPMGG